MRRRMAALVMVCLAWSLAPAALAQTTTTSTSTSSTSTSTTSTTVTSTTSTTTSTSTSTTSTTVANRCTGQPCTAAPPQASLAGANGEVAIELLGSCWTSPTPNAQGQTTALCVDSFRDPQAVLVVNRGETLTLRFATAGVPTRVSLERGDQSTPLTAGNPTRFGSDLPAGVYIVRFFTAWLQGDAAYHVRLDVRAPAGPATPTTGNITLTG